MLKGETKRPRKSSASKVSSPWRKDVEIHFHSPEAREVYLVGDFTGWNIYREFNEVPNGSEHRRNDKRMR